MLKYLTFNLKSRPSTRNCGSTSGRDPGPLPGHYRSLHIITSQNIQQSNCWATRKWQVWSDHIQVDWILSIIGGCCIKIWIQSRSSDCDRQRWNPCTHWSQEDHHVLPIYHTSHGEITLWNPVGWKISSRFGNPNRRKLWIRTRLPIEAGNNCSTSH